MAAGALAVIPARIGSTRLTRKPLRLIDGLPMIVRVLHQVLKAKGVGRVIVATDHHDIKHVTERSLSEIDRLRARVMMTDRSCASGTERVLEVARRLAASEPEPLPGVIINVQGDEPFVSPAHIEKLLGLVTNDVDVATLAEPPGSVAEEAEWDRNVVKCVVNHSGIAMHFSRSNMAGSVRHLGLYGFNSDFLLSKLPNLEPCELEEREKLEQLRWLYHGAKIRVGLVAGSRRGVDTEQDLLAANRQRDDSL